mmetsp:Transcript_60359/g.111987  ORF Transcript_60359/g.111987 Transcript_60359/m.111987 type:complete len:736 (-) Transcript_60359:147-2354(-)
MAEPAPAEEDGPVAAPATEAAPSSEEVTLAADKEAAQPGEEAAAAPATEADGAAAGEAEVAQPPEEAAADPEAAAAQSSEEAAPAEQKDDGAAAADKEAGGAEEAEGAQSTEEAAAAPAAEAEGAAASEAEAVQPSEEAAAAPETEAAQASEEATAGAEKDGAQASEEAAAAPTTEAEQAAGGEAEVVQPPEEAPAAADTEAAQPSEEAAPAGDPETGAAPTSEEVPASEQEDLKASEEVPEATDKETAQATEEEAAQGKLQTPRAPSEQPEQGSELITPRSEGAPASQTDAAEAKVEIVKVPNKVINIEAPAGSAGGVGSETIQDSARSEDALQGKLLTPTSGLEGMEQATPTSEGGLTSFLDPGEVKEDKEARLAGELAHVRSIGRTLESYRTGQDRSEVPSAWEDPDFVAQEMADLKRVRRQIRYLFGGMLGTMQETSPADATLRVDDLLSDRGSPELRRHGDILETPHHPVATSLGRPPPGIADPRLAQAPTSDSPPMPRRHGRPPPAPGARIPIAPEVPRASTESPAVGRPRSGHTELSSDASSSVTWGSQKGHEKGEDGEQRKERKERRHHRRHRHRQVSADPDFSRAEAPRPEESRHRQVSADPEFHRYDAQRWEGRGKRDDGAPPKPWNWAEEVMKASLDPENQWDFQVADGRRGASSPPVPARLAVGGSLPAWEKPRAPGAYRGGKDVALKTRERAEEVMRDEREKQRQLLMFDHPQAGARHRSYQ